MPRCICRKIRTNAFSPPRSATTVGAYPRATSPSITFSSRRLAAAKHGEAVRPLNCWCSSQNLRIEDSGNGYKNGPLRSGSFGGTTCPRGEACRAPGGGMSCPRGGQQVPGCRWSTPHRVDKTPLRRPSPTARELAASHPSAPPSESSVGQPPAGRSGARVADNGCSQPPLPALGARLRRAAAPSAKTLVRRASALRDRVRENPALPSDPTLAQA
jgi:hypothetical protein